jgi:serine protease Do
MRRFVSSMESRKNRLTRGDLTVTMHSPDQPRFRADALRRRVAAIAAAAALTFGVAAWTASGPAAASAPTATIAAPTDAVDRTIGGGTDSYAPVVSKVAPAVVTIRSERRARGTTQQQPPFMRDPSLRDFFGDRFGEGMPPAEARKQAALGSGVIVNADGYILTNHHVVDGADQVTVELKDRRSFTAKIVGTDAPSDLAVLKIEAHGLPLLPLGNSEAVNVGDIVLALGNPMGVGQTVTMGIISAKGRATGLGDGSFEDFLQTDAPINTGNSGGALVNTRGELVGINSQILSPSGGNIGIGFAIPVNMARAVMDALIHDGQVHRGRLGVTVQPITSDLARSLKLDAISGALINDVQPKSAADRAGLERGDVVLAINGQPVADGNELRNKIAQLGPGATVELTIVRQGQTHKRTATLEELPSKIASSGSPASRDTERTAGLMVEPLTPQRARQMGLDDESGLLVTRVDPDGPAADAGVRDGDVIQQVDGRPVSSADALRKSLASGDRPALVLVRRGEQSLFLTLERRNS